MTFTLVALVCTFGAIAFLVFSISVILILPAVFGTVGLASDQARTFGLFRWPALILVVTLLLAGVYRSSAPRDGKPWGVDLLRGFAAAVFWIGGSLLLSWYAAHAERFAAIYGSPTAIIGFMVWLWLTTVAVVVEAELSAAGIRSLSAHPVSHRHAQGGGGFDKSRAALWS
nr:YhjD/YihY/BrkB family envelope integrity protein [Methylobacterium segetis]